MPEYWTNGIATLYQSDARQIPIPDQSVHCVVTSPPYFGLRVYRSDSDAMIGLEETVPGWIDSMLAVMAEVGRVLRDDGVLWVNLGDSYGHGTSSGRQRSPTDGLGDGTMDAQNAVNRNGQDAGQLLMIPARFALAMQDAGWILRSDVIWAKKSCMPESLAGTRWEGDTLRRGSWRCTSSHEHLFQFVKGMNYYSDGESVKVKNGVSAIVQSPNLMGQRDHLIDNLGLQAPSTVGSLTPSGIAATSLFRVAVLSARAVLNIVQFDDDFSLLPLNAEEWQQLSGYFSGFASGDTPTVHRLASFSLRFLKGNTAAEEFVSQVYGLGLHLANMDLLNESGANGLALGLPSINTDGNAPVGVNDPGDIGQLNFSFHNDNYTTDTSTSLANRRNVWSDISPEPYGGEHYATFPSDLPRLCIQASTSVVGVCADCGSQWARVVDATEWRPTCTCNADKVPATVLDCFAGTGTTLLAAMRLGRRSVGVDLSTDYLGQAVKRLGKQSLPMLI